MPCLTRYLTPTNCAGYGDMYPTTAWGKFVGVVAALTGVILVALPISVISSKFNLMYQENLHVHKVSDIIMGACAHISLAFAKRGTLALAHMVRHIYIYIYIYISWYIMKFVRDMTQSHLKHVCARARKPV
jgi:hypothetical protein